MINTEFLPNWTSAPGDTIIDILRERNLSETELAQLMGNTPDGVKDLLQGRATITIAIARQLEQILGASVEFWMSRDFQYRQDFARLYVIDEAWLAELPIGDMIKYGWLKPVPHPSEEIAACLRYFDVSSVQAWRSLYGEMEHIAAFRKSPSFDSQPAAVATWLRQGEIEAEMIACNPWDAKQFQESLSYIRSLTLVKDPNRFIPKLKKCCAENGVAVVIVRVPRGCRASGATRFLSPQKALIMLSFRYLTDDHFWFTFFHEASHLLLHGERGFFLEGDDIILTDKENEANEFAASALIPSEYQTALMGLRVDARKVIRFALHVGVSPGIIVGQLQHLGNIGHNQLNSLKRHYEWGI